MKNRNLIFLILISAVLFTGCKILQPSMMLKTDKDYVFDIPEDSINQEYKIAPDDIIQFQLFSNDGFKMLERVDAGNIANTGVGMNMNNQRNNLSYPVEFDGVINLPIIGRIKVAGMTARECEFHLEELYSEFYIKPFVIVNISNRRVIIFPGSPGQAQVLPLISGQTTLLEALAQTGGIRSEGKAYKVKLIRGEAENPKVYSFDLSKIENLAQANIVLESDDIIYIEQRVRPIREILSEIQPVLALSSTILSLLAAVTLWRNIGSTP